MSGHQGDRRAATDVTGRRNVLRALTLFGTGALVNQLLPFPGQAFAQDAAPPAASPPAPAPGGESSAGKPGHYGPRDARGEAAEIYQKARTSLYPICRICPQCDGVACAGDYPGIGGIGSGRSFQNNYLDLQQVGLRMKLINGSGPADKKPDTSTVLFGQKVSIPAMAAPVGGVFRTLGQALSETEYFEAIVGGCADAGTLGAVGDSSSSPRDVVQARIGVIGRHGGRAIATIKPRQQANFIEVMRMAEEQKAAVIAIDIDSAARYGRAADPRAELSTKTLAELRQLVRATKTPFVIKGIMTVEDAELAAEAGAAGIVVSNHGGRVLDYTPGTARVLPAIAKRVGGKMTILVDGCVRSGADVLKYLALGANGVLVGRHLIRAAYGGGRQGVKLFMEIMRRELETSMVMTGVPNIRSVNRSILA